MSRMNGRNGRKSYDSQGYRNIDNAPLNNTRRSGKRSSYDEDDFWYEDYDEDIVQKKGNGRLSAENSMINDRSYTKNSKRSGNQPQRDLYLRNRYDDAYYDDGYDDEYGDDEYYYNKKYDDEEYYDDAYYDEYDAYDDGYDDDRYWDEENYKTKGFRNKGHYGSESRSVYWDEYDQEEAYDWDDRAVKRGSSRVSKDDWNTAAPGAPVRRSQRRQDRQPEQSGKKGKKTKKKRRRSLPIRIMMGVLGFLLVLLAVGTGLFFYYFGGLRTTHLTTDWNELGIDANKVVTDEKVTNIALFGVDTRDSESDSGLSDAIIILTIDQRHSKIKLTSILRDSYVPIEGYGNRKINSAYSLGGAPLAIKTLNQNFNLDIQEYVTVNFAQLAQVIDAVGGVEIEITNEEKTAANTVLKEMDSTDYITSSGKVHLNGIQATAYSRIRKIDSDVQRAGRQQTVLIALFDKAMNMSATQYPELARKLLPIVETSLSYSDILNLIPIALTPDIEIAQNTIPGEEEDAIGGMYNGIWCWRYDLDKAAQHIQEIIYE